MSDVVLSLGSLIIGVIATLIVARYYFQRTVSKALTPYIQSSAALFRGVTPEVRKQLKIEYKGVPVEHLQELQFLIANTGERAIRDVIEPLRLELPDTVSILDAALLYKSPQERQVTVSYSERAAVFEFPLLNSDDFFIVRILARGKLSSDKLRFCITADDLPPVLTPSWGSPNLVTSSERKRQFEWGLLVPSVVFMALGAAVAWLIAQTWAEMPHTRDLMWGLLPDLSWTLVPTVAAAIPAVALIVIGVMMFFGAFGDYSFPRQRRFIVPKDFLRPHRRIFIEDYRGVRDAVGQAIVREGEE